MTEEEWLDNVDASLAFIQKSASIRKLRLFAAAYAGWLQTRPAYAYAIHCAHIIEEVADEPKSWEELEPRLWNLPGGSELNGWQLTHTLRTEDRQSIARAVTGMVAHTIDEEPDILHAKLIAILYEIFGNPFRPVAINSSCLSTTSAVYAMSDIIYRNRCFDRLPILADALEEAGCSNDDILRHCRSEGQHVRGCWVVDLILGKQ